MRIINLLVICWASFFCKAQFALATEWKIKDDAQNKVSFEATGNPGFLRINGDGAKSSGILAEKDGKVSGEVTVITADFKTGIDARDGHMKEKYLGTGAAKFVLDPVLPNATGFDFTGKLTIKADTVAVKGQGKISTVEKGHVFTGGFKIALKDFPSIGVPSYKGITVAEDVTVKVTFLAEP